MKTIKEILLLNKWRLITTLFFFLGIIFFIKVTPSVPALFACSVFCFIACISLSLPDLNEDIPDSHYNDYRVTLTIFWLGKIFVMVLMLCSFLFDQDEAFRMSSDEMKYAFAQSFTYLAGLHFIIFLAMTVRAIHLESFKENIKKHIYRLFN